jgi:hypothetical protein
MSNSLTVCLLLVLAIIAFNEFRTAQADPSEFNLKRDQESENRQWKIGQYRE